MTALHALGSDDHPDVATYLGYANRKLGRYDEAKYWYDKALTPIPTTRTWAYYRHVAPGARQSAQGGGLPAEDQGPSAAAPTAALTKCSRQPSTVP